MSIKLRYPVPGDAEWMLKQEQTSDAKAYAEYDSDYTLTDIKNFIDLNRAGADPSQTRLIIEVDGKAAGMVDMTGISKRNGHAELGIFVSKEFRGKGIGTEGLREAIQIAAMMGISHMKVMVSTANEASARLFRKCGFEKIGELPGWLKHGKESAEIYYLSMMDSMSEEELERDAAEAALDEFSLYGIDKEDPYAAEYLRENGFDDDYRFDDDDDEFGGPRFESLDGLDI